MPKFTFTSPEGKTYDIEGPEGATKEQAFQVLQQRLSSKPSSDVPVLAQGTGRGGGMEPTPTREFSPGEKILGGAETALSILSGIPASIAGQAYGLLGGAYRGATGRPLTYEQMEKAASDAAKSITYQPRTAAGREMTQTLGERFEESKLAGLPIEGPKAFRVPGVPSRTLGEIGESTLGRIPRPPSEAVRASRASGIPLTLGQETGSTSLKFLENRLKELFPSKGLAAKDEATQVAAGANRINQLAEQISSRATADPEAVGNSLRSAYKSTVTKLDKARDAQASKDYGDVRQLAGDKPVIAYKNTLETLDKIIAENQNVPAADARKVLAQAKNIRDALTESAPSTPPSTILGPSGKPAIPAAPSSVTAATHTIEDAMKTRSAWGKAARRTGNIFSDIDPNANQVLAKRLFGAINKDFEAASTSNTPIAQALKAANENYAKASQSITFLEKSALGKLLGEDVVDALGTGATASTKAPEAIAKKYLTMTPSEAKSVTNILEQHAPEALQDAKAFVLRNGLEAAKNEVPGAPPISFGKFRKEIDKVAPKLKEMGFTAKEIADIKDVTDTMARAGDRTGINPSGTTGAAHMLSIPALAVTHPFAALGAIVTPYVAAKALLTPQGRELLRTAYTSVDRAEQSAAANALKAYASGLPPVGTGGAIAAGLGQSLTPATPQAQSQAPTLPALPSQ